MDLILTRAEILNEVSRLRSCVERGDYKEAAKLATRVGRYCRKSRPDYDYRVTEWEYLSILQNLERVDYGVGGYLAPVTW